MCTVTWSANGAGYQVWFNRDEQRTRPPAEPPRRHERHGVAYLAPNDPRGGGTWLAVNEYGFTVGVLNYYAAGLRARSATPRSRGLLVRDLADVKSLDEMNLRLDGESFEHYPPFLLLVWAPSGEVAGVQWDGQHALPRRWTEADRPVTTSSFRSADVVARRRAIFHQMSPDADSLRAFHLSRDAGDDAFSVWMSRPDAQTVSLSRVEVGPERAAFFYAPRDARDRPGAETVLTLNRR
jgi:hypothetical protein